MGVSESIGDHIEGLEDDDIQALLVVLGDKPDRQLPSWKNIQAESRGLVSAVVGLFATPLQRRVWSAYMELGEDQPRGVIADHIGSTVATVRTTRQDIKKEFYRFWIA